MNPFRLGQMWRSDDQAHGRPFAALRAAAAVGALLVAVVLIVGDPATAAPQATIIRCDPATVAGPLGGTVDVDIYVENVVDLWAADVRLGFDTTALQVVGPPIDPLSPELVHIQLLDTFLSPDVVVWHDANNTAGLIRYAASQINNPQNPKDPVSGSGPLAKITFRTLRAGQFTLPITYHKIVLITGQEIPSTAQGCSVTFFDVASGGVTFVPFTAAN